MSKTYELVEYGALSLQLQEKEKATVRMTSGTAEMFGTQLTDQVYRFENESRIYLYTYSGCKLDLGGSFQGIVKIFPDEKIDQSMKQFVTLSYGFQDQRVAAKGDASKSAPIIMVVGGKNTGKSTLCRILLNYAVRKGETPIYVDLDCGQNAISIPGSIGAVVVNETADIVNGFWFKKPLVYYFGSTSPNGGADEKDLQEAYINTYTTLVERLSVAVKQRLEYEKKSGKHSGVIINTCGWIENVGIDIIKRAISVFNVNTVLSFDPKLTTTLANYLSADMKVIKVLKSTRHAEKDAKKERKKKEEWYAVGSDFQKMDICLKDLDFYFHNYLKDPPRIGLWKIGVDDLKKCEGKYLGVSNHTSLPVSNLKHVLGQSICGFVYLQKIHQNTKDIKNSRLELFVPEFIDIGIHKIILC